MSATGRGPGAVARPLVLGLLLAAAAGATEDVTASALVAAGSAAVATPARLPHPPPRPGEVRVLRIPQLGNFPYDPHRGGTIPPDVLALTGLHVRMRGTVTPWDLDQDRVVRFALTDGQSCCFGGPPRLQHVVVVRYPPGMALALADGWVEVEGVLSVREERAEGMTTGIFSIDASRVVASHR